MQSVTPELDAPRIRVGPPEGKTEADGFNTIVGAGVHHHTGESLVYAFRPTDTERAKIAEGADIYVSLLTYGGSPQGIMVMTGRDEASAVFNVRELPAPIEAPADGD